MDLTELAAGADGESVTEDRLTDPVLDALVDGEQPHHLLTAQSLDRSRDGDTERLYPSVNASVSVVATERRVLFVVPKTVANETASVEYDSIDSVAVENGELAEFRIECDSLSVVAHLSSGQAPSPAASFVRTRLTAATEAERPSASSQSTLDASDEAESGRETESDTVPTSDPDAETANPLDRIEQLAELKADGILSEEEFETRKQQLLDRL